MGEELAKREEILQCPTDKENQPQLNQYKAYTLATFQAASIMPDSHRPRNVGIFPSCSSFSHHLKQTSIVSIRVLPPPFLGMNSFPRQFNFDPHNSFIINDDRRISN